MANHDVEISQSAAGPPVQHAQHHLRSAFNPSAGMAEPSPAHRSRQGPAEHAVPAAAVHKQQTPGQAPQLGSSSGPEMPAQGLVTTNAAAAAEPRVEHPKKRGKARTSAAFESMMEEPVPSQHICYNEAGPQTVKIAMSGFSYEWWHQNFYRGVPKQHALEFYARHFNCIELNTTFYQFVPPRVYESWAQRAAGFGHEGRFEYVVKAWKYFSHMKRLNIDDDFRRNWGKIWVHAPGMVQANCELLKPHLGPVLFQFHTSFMKDGGTSGGGMPNVQRLRALGQVLPAGEKFAFEFRDPSWFCEEVYDIMRENDWCLVMVDSHRSPGAREHWMGTMPEGTVPGPRRYPVDACSWGVYCRFHGTAGQYVGEYGVDVMGDWSQHAKRWTDGGRAVYFAFNNTDEMGAESADPAAIADARHLAAALHHIGVFSRAPTATGGPKASHTRRASAQPSAAGKREASPTIGKGRGKHQKAQ